MTPDSEGLHPIANTERPDRRADIVFVHGVGGASHSTWRCGKEGTDGHFFWPEELGKDLPTCGIWSIGYPAGFTGLGRQGMIIEKRAGNVSDTLANSGLGDRPIIFITHSMGGLILKHLIVDSQTLPGEDRKRIVSWIRGIVFCGTPHKGSGFADAARVFGMLGGGSQAHVDEMRANADQLDFLHDKFIEWHRLHPIHIDSHAENHKLSITRWFFFATDYGIVVSRASANPNIAGCEVHDSDDDHLTLVKPRNRSHNVYAGVLRFIKRTLAASARATSSIPAAPTALESRVGVETRPAPSSGIQVDISRIVKYAPAELIGRDDQKRLLSDAWGKTVRAEKGRPHVLTYVALGGEGKTSLVAKWAAELAHQDWPGCDAAFAWSFYSQGTRAATSDLFLKEALVFFGDAAMAESAQGAFEKGRRLAQLVGERRALLILDGLEPLQYSTTSPTAGELKDQGLAALLKRLATASNGLCVVTTRYSIPDLRAWWQTTAPEEKLTRLSRTFGVALLQSLGVKGSLRLNIPFNDGREQVNEFEKLVEDVQGHALTLQIMGEFLKRAFGGDIRRRDLVKFEKADQKVDGGHAFRAMGAYAQWMEDGSEEAKRELAILRLMGLFDRPATSDCIEALLKLPAIVGLTEPLVGFAEDDWNFSLDVLESAKLLTVNRDAAGVLLSLDAHPLLREYFAGQLRTRRGEAWRAAHRRLYEHLCASTQEGDEPTLGDLQPLYQAVAHGCQAGLQQQAREKVYRDRILRGTGSDGFYSTKRLGASGSDLGAIAWFFEQPWSRLSPGLQRDDQAWMLNEAATRLRALGRLTEALEPMRANLTMRVEREDWQHAPSSAGNLSELELTLGEVAGAEQDGAQSVTYADRSGDAFQRMSKRATHADALHQAGRRSEAETRFREAEQMQKEMEPDYPLLYSLRGFRYCDLLLAVAERAAWRMRKESGAGSQESELIEACRAVSQRAAQTLKWVTGKLGLLDEALDHLTLGSAELYAAMLESPKSHLARAISELNAAVDGLRRAGTQHYLPRALLARAWLRCLEGELTRPGSAQEDLDEAWEIAKRGSMKLFMADIHLYRARLFGAGISHLGSGEKYPWKSPETDLEAAAKLIESCGYGRRKEELADARLAILE